MKRRLTPLSIFSALLVLLCGFIFLSCEDSENPFKGPKDKWCEKDFTYQGTEFDCFFYYSDTGWTDGTTSQTKLRDDVAIGPGLTILIVPYNNEGGLVEVVSKNQFAIKTFANGTSVSGENEESSGSFSVSETSWNLLASAYPSLKSGSSQLPSQLVKNNADTYTQIGDYSNFSWKKILAGILVEQLLE